MSKVMGFASTDKDFGRSSINVPVSLEARNCPWLEQRNGLDNVDEYKGGW